VFQESFLLAFAKTLTFLTERLPGENLMNIIEKEIDGEIYHFDLDEFNLGLPTGTIIRTEDGFQYITCSVDDPYNKTNYSIRTRIESQQYSLNTYLWIRELREGVPQSQSIGFGQKPSLIDTIEEILMPFLDRDKCCLWMNHPYYCCSKKGVG